MAQSQRSNPDKIMFLIEPGYVRSINDGDRHYVGAAPLAKLYELQPTEWRVYDDMIDRHTNLPILRPKRNGRYGRPT